MAEPLGRVDGCAVVNWGWSEGGCPALTAGAGARENPVYRGALNLCRLVQVLSGMDQIGLGRVGLVGEGYGASMAIIAAALLPEKVAFVVAHQPICEAVSPDGRGGCPRSRP